MLQPLVDLLTVNVKGERDEQLICNVFLSCKRVAFHEI